MCTYLSTYACPYNPHELNGKAAFTQQVKVSVLNFRTDKLCSEVASFGGLKYGCGNFP